jgi:hypothetical protein
MRGRSPLRCIVYVLYVTVLVQREREKTQGAEPPHPVSFYVHVVCVWCAGGVRVVCVWCAYGALMVRL